MEYSVTDSQRTQVRDALLKAGAAQEDVDKIEVHDLDIIFMNGSMSENLLVSNKSPPSPDELSMIDLLTKLPLSSAPTVGNLSATCTVSIHAVSPVAVEEWADFAAKANEWCKAAASTLPEQAAPDHVSGMRPKMAQPIESEGYVYAYFSQQVAPAFNALFDLGVLGPKLKIGEGDLGKSQADKSVKEVATDRVLVPIEMKHSGVLNSSTMSTPLHEYVAPVDKDKKTDHAKAVEQMFGYLACNDLCFGLLCSNNEYWFCWRTKNVFYISCPLQHNQSGPTVIGALCYVAHLAAEDAARRASASPASIPLAPVPRKSNKGPKTPLIPGLPSSASLILSNLAIWLQKLILDIEKDGPAPKTYSAASLNLDLDELLGSGGTGAVFAGCTSLGLPLAIKVPSKHGRQHYGPKECEMSLDEEADNYQALKELQGKVIPRHIARGTILNGAHDKIPFIAIERIVDGVPLKEIANNLVPAMLEMVVEQAYASVRSLHQSGVAHGDLDNGGNNILVTPEGEVWLIDLGSVVMNASKESLEGEERELRGLLQHYLPVDPPLSHSPHQGPASSSPLSPQRNMSQSNMHRQALPNIFQQRKTLPPLIRHKIATSPSPSPSSGLAPSRAFK